MVTVSDFIEYCVRILEIDFGKMSNEIITEMRKKKNLDENSTAADLKQFIDLIEANIATFSGKPEATRISNLLRMKASEVRTLPAKEDYTSVDKNKEITSPAVEDYTVKTADDINNLEYIENKILIFLESGYKIDNIFAELNIEEVILADKIIDLDSKGLITLEDKNWVLTQKGKDAALKGRMELLKKIKIDYLHGTINKEDFLKKRYLFNRA
jgi:phage I-like protein